MRGATSYRASDTVSPGWGVRPSGAAAPRSPLVARRHTSLDKLKSCDRGGGGVGKNEPGAAGVAPQPWAAVRECSGEDNLTARIRSCLLRLIRLHHYGDFDINVAKFRHMVFTRRKQFDPVQWAKPRLYCSMTDLVVEPVLCWTSQVLLGLVRLQSTSFSSVSMKPNPLASWQTCIIWTDHWWFQPPKPCCSSATLLDGSFRKKLSMRFLVFPSDFVPGY